MKKAIEQIRSVLPDFQCDSDHPSDVLREFVAQSEKLPNHKRDLMGGRIVGKVDLILQSHVTFMGVVFVGEGVSVGPYTLIRGPVFLGDGVHIGPHSEIVRSVFLKDSVVGHKGMICDSVIGENVKIAASFTTANLRMDENNIESTWEQDSVDTGGNKGFGVTIGDCARIGANVFSMPGAYVEPNQTVIGPSLIDSKGKVKPYVN